MAPTPDNQASGDEAAKTLRAVATLGATEVQVDDKVYDAQALAETHPGGDLFVKVFAGFDATEAFLSYHRRRFPHDKVSSALVGRVADKDQARDPAADADYLELCARVDKVLPRDQAFAPWHYYLKVLVLLGSAFSLELYQHRHGAYHWSLGVAQGLLFAWIGMNIQHDANHGAISRAAWVNRLLGMSQNYIGGSALDWIHQHVVQHHIHPNDASHDPDIVGSDFLRLNPLKPLSQVIALQHVYVFLLFAFFGMSYIATSLVHLMQGFHFTKMSPLVRENRVFEALTIVLFFLRWLALPVWRTGSLSVLLQVLPMFVTGGYYLSFFFIISHNFEGAALNHELYTQLEDKSFLRRQVLTASNVGGSWLCVLNGGLNYQIEHHLFPRIQHSHYPRIAPVVRAYCAEKGIAYVHFPTVYDNVASCVRHLYQMGHQALPSGYHGPPVDKKKD